MKTYQKKICLLGHFAVGKTSLTRRFVEGRFDEKYLSTIGIHISKKTIVYNDVRFELLIWDLAGGERFMDVGPYYLRGAVGAVVVCDVTDARSSWEMPYHASQLREVNENAHFVFAGNKSDLVDEQVVSLDDLRGLSADYGGQALLTSAKDGTNVSEAFELLVAQLYRQE